MPRATREQIDAAIEFYRQNPTVDPKELSKQMGVSPETARRITSGERDTLSSPVLETPDLQSQGPAPTSRKAKSSKRRLREPADDAVESLYTLSCVIAGTVLSVAPPQYQLTATDQEMILRPLSRMYLRRQSVPTLNPDARDLMTVLIGVFGYGVHAMGGRYAGRDSGPGARAGFSNPRAGQPGGGASTAAPYPPPSPPPGVGSQPAGNGAATIEPNPYDPQTIMDNLEARLRAAQAADTASESNGEYAGMAGENSGNA